MPETLPFDLSAPLRIHLVGVGGAGISAIAMILATMGHRVSGADVHVTPAWPPLRAAGVEVELTEAAQLFATAEAHRPDVVAHSTAFAPTEADRARAEVGGWVLVDRATILGGICAARRTVAVSGTHGKTSTTAMLATLLHGVGADPSFLVGAVPVGLDEAARWGGSDGVFVVEADESDGSFLALGPEVAVVTNVDEDHLDHWGSVGAIEAAFERFVGDAQVAVVCTDDPGDDGAAGARAARLASRHGALTVGEGHEARYRIHDVQVDRLATSFGLVADGTEVGPVSIATPGRHHARNAAVAVAAAAAVGVAPRDAVAALGAYAGVSRRFEVLGEAGGVVVVDDYAHNPGKVRALVGSAAEAGWARVVVVFQPHRYSRTRDQGAELGGALAAADVVAVTDVYGAGEAPLPGVSGETVLAAARRARPPELETASTPTLDDAAAWAAARLGPGDLCLTVGAGDVATLGPRILAALRGEGRS